MTIERDNKIAQWDETVGAFVGDKDLAYIANLIYTASARIGNNSFENVIEEGKWGTYEVTAYVPDVFEEGLLDGI